MFRLFKKLGVESKVLGAATTVVYYKGKLPVRIHMVAPPYPGLGFGINNKIPVLAW